MKITIADEAQKKLKELLGNTKFEKPALRLMIAGIG